MEEGPSPIDRYIATLAGVATPRICFIPTASGDPIEMIEKFYAAFEPLGSQCSLAFFRKPFRSPLPLADYARPLLDQHLVFVGGGNTKSALAVWREWKLDRILREAWLKGVVLSGMSAGAMCWFAQGLTDSYWGAGMKPLECLAFVPGSCCVHYNGDAARRPALHRARRDGELKATLAIDDGAAVLVLFADADIARVGAGVRMRRRIASAPKRIELRKLRSPASSLPEPASIASNGSTVGVPSRSGRLPWHSSCAHRLLAPRSRLEAFAAALNGERSEEAGTTA